MRARAVAVVAAAAVLVGCSPSVNEAGPLVVSEVAHSYVYLVDGQESFTDGFDILTAPEGEDIVIETVRSIGVEGMGVLLAATGEDGTYQSFDSFPPDLIAEPAEGATLLAGSGDYQLLIGYDLTELDEPATRSGVEVTYRVGEDRYSDFIPAGLVICPVADEVECNATSDELVEGLTNSK